MVSGGQLSNGMIIRLENRLYRVQATSKVSIGKSKSFVKLQLQDLQSYQIGERKLPSDQDVQEVALCHSEIEFLYPDERGYLFLDINTLEQLGVDQAVVGPKINYLKEGVIVTASCYGGEVYAIELPQFLEIMIAQIASEDEMTLEAAPGECEAILETGARVVVPIFIEEGDVVKVDTRAEEFVQRV